MKRPIVLIGLVAILAVVLAGCGGSKSTNNATASGGGGAYGYGAPAKPASAPAKPAAAGATTIALADHGLGKMLVDASGRTLYLWRADTGLSSTCSGACAQGWPPVTTTGTPKATGGVHAGWLGTVKRADGTTQVTYGGHPLYRFAGDTAAGQTNGQGSTGFGSPWYVVSATGSAITKAAS